MSRGIGLVELFEDVEDLQIFDRLMQVNYLGAVNCIHAALPHLKQSRGMIVCISSIQSKLSVPLHSGYVASKHALQGFCDTLRMELDGSGVGVLTVLPHWLRGTELRRHALGKDGKPLGPSSRKHSKESITVEAASKAILDAVDKRKRELVIPWKLRLLAALNHLKPRLAESIIKAAMSKQDHTEVDR